MQLTAAAGGRWRLGCIVFSFRLSLTLLLLPLV